MIDFPKKELSEIAGKLNQQRQKKTIQLIGFLFERSEISGILLGGSIAYKEETKLADVDLFCLTSGTITAEPMKQIACSLEHFDVCLPQGFYPWTETLYTIYFKDDLDFTIDLGLVPMNKGQDFFWEPAGKILLDRNDLINQWRSRQMAQPAYSMQPLLPKDPHIMFVVSLKKIYKNISRNHLWNALDQVRNLRKYLMQIIRVDYLRETNFLGRVDRDIEDILPQEIADELSRTVPGYDAQDICDKTLLLISLGRKYMTESITLKDEQKMKWILKHMEHEAFKLMTNIGDNA